jgi:hypothetical protein
LTTWRKEARDAIAGGGIGEEWEKEAKLPALGRLFNRAVSAAKMGKPGIPLRRAEPLVKSLSAKDNLLLDRAEAHTSGPTSLLGRGYTGIVEQLWNDRKLKKLLDDIHEHAYFSTSVPRPRSSGKSALSSSYTPKDDALDTLVHSLSDLESKQRSFMYRHIPRHNLGSILSERLTERHGPRSEPLLAKVLRNMVEARTQVRLKE